MNLGNGLTVTKGFDRRYNTDSIKTSTAGVFGRRYKYDHSGNITQLLDLIDNTKSYNTITYDGLDRLTQAYGLNRTDSLFFTYQKNGNRLTKRKGNQILTNYNYVNNRLRNTTGAEVVNYGYNANGSNIGDTLGAGTLTYIYDKLNRMIKITGITPADTFAYDGENRRIYSKESGVQLVNLYDIFGNLIAQYPAGSGLYTTDYIWANGEPRMRIDTLTGFGLAPLAPGGPTESPYWYHTDHLGTPYVLTDTLKAIQWQISLDPFGETVSENTPVISDNLRFPGQLADRGSLLNYNWNRYYQPKIGRYYQVDPEFMQASTSPYAYVTGNPIKLTDRTGAITDKNIKECGKKTTRVVKAIKEAVKVAKRCLPGFEETCGNVDYFVSRANTQIFKCTNTPSEYCGQTSGETTLLFNDAFTNKPQCGILPSVIFHEILHTFPELSGDKAKMEARIREITAHKYCFGTDAAPLWNPSRK